MAIAQGITSGRPVSVVFPDSYQGRLGQGLPLGLSPVQLMILLVLAVLDAYDLLDATRAFGTPGFMPLAAILLAAKVFSGNPHQSGNDIDVHGQADSWRQ